ncbi:MAG: PAS domain S-box protein [Desulfobacteria bacterium]
MGVLRRFLPKVIRIGLFLSVAIFPLVEQEAGTAVDPLTPEERAFVVSHGPIRYAPDPLFPPFEFLDSSGVARGITPDLLAIMGKKLGVEFRTVAYPTWSDVLEAVKQGKVDILGTLTRTPEREGFLLFSRPYLSVPYVLFVRENGSDPETIDDMVSRRLGVVKNYGINTWLSAEHPNIHPVAVEDTATGITMVATGQLDAMLEALPVGVRIVREKSLTNIRIVPRHIYTLPQHFGVRKEEPFLLSIVQKGLDLLTETERSEVFVRWTGQDFSRPPPAISPLLRDALLILVAAAVLSWAWIVALRRSVRRATQSLRESEERYRELFENANDIIYTHDLAGNFTSINKVAEQALGYTLDEALKSNMFSILAPEYVDVVRQMMSRKVAEGSQTQYELEVVCKDDRRVPLEVSTRIIYRRGKAVGVQGIARDITDRKRAEAEKEKLQSQLQQAQKMEAVGRLAGGVAHDFNNLLTVITGYSELLLRKIGKESPMYGDLDEIKRAGERAALMTRQLLAFSRKQIIEPKVIHLDHLVAEMHKMLTRLIGEDISIQVTTGKSTGSVKVDPGQFQQILMNLAVNARDAMPGGGKIVIETANVDLDAGYCASHPYVTPGRYVMLSVSDTGKGMSEEVKAHIFEPFFTTKAKGSGTGLGLATTYGVVKQAGGSIEVYSEVGIGTTIKIYLPRVEEQAVKPVNDDRPTDLPGGTEMVLVVEDEDIVRNLCVQILERLGYRVLQARNGTEAIAEVRGYGDRIDLLLTDVVMPGMNGSELATQLVRHHPEMKVLFTSGYTDDAIVHHGVLDEGVMFIGKPYTPLALARKVREVLDGE